MTSCQTKFKLPSITVPLLNKDASVSLITLVSKESVYVPSKLTNSWCFLFHFLGCSQIAKPAVNWDS